MDMELWERYKNAALEYALYRPHLVQITYPLAAGATSISVVNPLGVKFCSYGVELTEEEYATADPNLVSGWCFMNGALHLTALPAAQNVTVVWEMTYVPDENTQTFPGIPFSDIMLIRWLAEAEELEAAQNILDAGISSYTIGSTTVRWSGQGSGSNSPNIRSRQLRQRALQALNTPLADWG